MLASMYPPLPLAILSFILAFVVETDGPERGCLSSMSLLTLPCWASRESTPRSAKASDACLVSRRTDAFCRPDATDVIC